MTPPATTSRAGFRGGLEIPGWDLFYRGKVRDLYRRPGDPEHMLMVATDRLSAFDVVMNETVPDRGRVLTHITEYWLKAVREWMPAARISLQPEDVPGLPSRLHDSLRGRLTWTRVADRVDVEIVLRARLAGSGWREYARSGTLWGQPLPPGLQNSDPLPEILLTPTTKAEKDEPITWEQAVALIGSPEEAEQVRRLAFRLFEEAAGRCEQRGLVLADTKFEFGRLDGGLVLIDEVLTPDSSRYWPAAELRSGREPPSYDKEIVRAHLRGLEDWNRQPPPPPLPAPVLERTRSRYLDLCRILTGSLPPGMTA